MELRPHDPRWRSDLEGELGWMQVLARRLVHGEEEASELVQETFLAALTRPPGDQGRPRAWLRTVMGNLARQRGRRAWVKRRVELVEPEPSDPAPAPGADQEQEELERLLLSELATLDEPFRSTLRQHFLGGLQLVQIARRDGVPEGTVRWRLKAGIERLRLRLDHRYGDRGRWLAGLLPFAGPKRQAPVERPFPLGLAAGGVLAGVLVVAAAWILLGSESEREPGPLVSETATTPVAPPVATLPNGVAEPAQQTLAPASSLESGLERELDVTVLDAAGVAVGAAEVFVFGPGGFEPRGHTTPDGRARVALHAADLGALGVPMAHDRIVLRAAAEGHAVSDALFLSADETDAVELTLAGRERVLRGRVSSADGAPLAGVGVHAVLDPARTTPEEEGSFAGPLALSTVSAEDGSYELRGLAARPYAIVVTRAGCEPSIVLVNAERDELPLVFVPGGTVRGRVVEEHGAPAVRARVWAEPLHRGTDWCAGIPGYRSDLRGFALEARTDEQGWYELYDVHPRTRRLRAASAADPGASASALRVVPSGASSDWSVFLAREPGHRLRLLDEHGAALAGWVVHLVGKRPEGGSFARQLVADSVGRVVGHDTGGEVEVLVYGPSGTGQPLASRKLVASEEEVNLVVPAETRAHLVGRVPPELLAADAEAHVVAYDLGSGQPFALELERDSGRFRAELGPGRYAVLLSGSLGAAWLSEVTLEHGERRRLGKFTLPDTGSVLLRADRPEALAGNYRFERCFGRNSMKWQEGALPLFGAHTLHAGLYRLDTVGAGGLVESGWIEVEPGAARTLDFTSLARVEISARPVPERESRKTWLEVVAPGLESRREAPEGVRRVRLQRRTDGLFRHALRLPEGEWLVRIVDENEVGSERSVRVPASGGLELEW